MSQKQKKLLSKLAKQRTGNRNPHWKGGKRIIGGYYYIYSPNHPNKTQEGYVCEHRLIMEQKLGRLLKPEEQIHHMNHNRLDNRIENLLLLSSNSEHQKIENKFKKRNHLGQFLQ